MISFPATSISIWSQPRTGPPRRPRWRASSPTFSRARRPRRPDAVDLKFLPSEEHQFSTRLETVGGARMKRTTQRVLPTHTGSLPRPAGVVELLLHEQEHPGTEAAKLKDAVRRAVSEVVTKQVGCGLDI